MSQDSFTLDVRMHVPSEVIVNHLMQPENYLGLQPFLVSTQVLEQGLNTAGQAYVRYRSVEHVPLFAGLNLPTPLDVVTTLTKPAAQIISLVKSNASVQVEFVYDFSPADSAAHLTLRVTAHAPRLLTHFILNRARQAQTVVLNNLKTRLETASGV